MAHFVEHLECGAEIAGLAEVFDEDVADASVGGDAEMGLGMGEKGLGEIETGGGEEEVEAGGEGFGGGFEAGEGENGEEGIEGFLMEGSTREEGHKGEEDGLVEAAGLGGDAVEESVDGEELAGACEAEEDGGVGGVVVGEAGLRGARVEEVKGLLGVGVVSDQADGVSMGDEAAARAALGGAGRRGRGGRFQPFRVVERRDPGERGRTRRYHWRALRASASLQRGQQWRLSAKKKKKKMVVGEIYDWSLRW